MDLDVRAVLDAVAARGRPTIVVVVADHGESLYDHGELLHGDAYFDGVINVPLVMRVPGLAGRVVPALVSQVDLLPTLLQLVGAVAPAGIDGRSLVPLLRGEADAVRGVALVEGGVARAVTGDLRGAVVALPWTLLRQNRGCGGPPHLDPPRTPGEAATCLFDVSADPGQTRNVALSHPEVVADLTARWKAFRDTRGADATPLALDPAFVEQLRKSGYDFRGEP
jgi:arylsulfatase A-like enzyme